MRVIFVTSQGTHNNFGVIKPKVVDPLTGEQRPSPLPHPPPCQLTVYSSLSCTHHCRVLMASNEQCNLSLNQQYHMSEMWTSDEAEG